MQSRPGCLLGVAPKTNIAMPSAETARTFTLTTVTEIPRTADLLPVIDAIRAEGIERGIPMMRGGRWQAVQVQRSAAESERIDWGGRERPRGGPDTRARYVGRVHSLPRSFATSPFITSTPLPSSSGGHLSTRSVLISSK